MVSWISRQWSSIYRESVDGKFVVVPLTLTERTCLGTGRMDMLSTNELFFPQRAGADAANRQAAVGSQLVLGRDDDRGKAAATPLSRAFMSCSEFA